MRTERRLLAGLLAATMVSGLAGSARGQDSHVQIVPVILPSAVVAQEYCGAGDVSLFAQGGTPRLEWTLEPGERLPPGMTLSPAGRLCGTPDRVGRYRFVVRVADAAGFFDTSNVFLDVESDGDLAISTFTIPPVSSGTEAIVELSAIRGDEPYQWSLLPGPVPQGLRLRPDGTLILNLTEGGIFPFAVQVEDASGRTDVRPLVVEAFSNAPTPDAGVGSDAGPGTPLDSGVPTPNDSDLADASVEGCGCSATAERGRGPFGGFLLLGVAALAALRRRWVVVGLACVAPLLAAPSPPIPVARIQPGPLPPAIYGASYEAQFNLRQGADTGEWGLIFGRLPAGMSLTADGRLVGTPTQVGRFLFSVEYRSQDFLLTRDVDQFELEVLDDLPPDLETRVLRGQVGQAFDAGLEISDGQAPYQWTILEGRLPEGLVSQVDAATGQLVIRGTPVEPTLVPLLVEAEDAAARRILSVVAIRIATE